MNMEMFIDKLKIQVMNRYSPVPPACIHSGIGPEIT